MKTPEHIQRIQKRKSEMLDKWERRPSYPGEIVLYNAWTAILKHYEKNKDERKQAK